MLTELFYSFVSFTETTFVLGRTAGYLSQILVWSLTLSLCFAVYRQQRDAYTFSQKITTAILAMSYLISTILYSILSGPMLAEKITALDIRLPLLWVIMDALVVFAAVSVHVVYNTQISRRSYLILLLVLIDSGFLNLSREYIIESGVFWVKAPDYSDGYRPHGLILAYPYLTGLFYFAVTTLVFTKEK